MCAGLELITETENALATRTGANQVPVVCHGVSLCKWHSTGVSDLVESLRLTSEIVARRRLRSVDSPTLLVPSTRRSTLGDRAFPVAAARAWNSLPPQTRADSSILTFRRETKSHLFRQSFGWQKSGTVFRWLIMIVHSHWDKSRVTFYL